MVSGQEVYSQYCLVCHQVKGGGVRGLNPPLSGTDYVLGDPGRLISILIEGSNVGLEVNGATYSNAMPGFSYLSDDEIACVATYIRNSFGNSASAVSTAEVRALRHPEP
jgi:mono/diheme cytochrome c family protein